MDHKFERRSAEHISKTKLTSAWILEGCSVDIRELKVVRSELDLFLAEFDDCIKTRASRAHLRTYVGGQVSSLPRKSIEPIALDAGVPPRSLQEFLGLHRWDHEAMRERVQTRVVKRHADPNAIAVFDETSFAKKGEKTAGVQRQYCGSLGKTENCVVTVHLGYVAGEFHALIDGDLYLPEETWDSDRARCRAAGIPDSVIYRPKWQIALDLLRRARSRGVVVKYATGDEGYGRYPEFRANLDDMNVCYVLEVPVSVRGTPANANDESRVRSVETLWLRGGPSWNLFHVKDSDKGPVVWEARATRFVPWNGGWREQECWLLVARNVLDGEEKYFLSNAPADATPEDLLHVAFSRWHIERIFEDSKGEIGFGHFEVRNYQPLIRHLILSMVSLLFLEEQTERLRGGKSVVERVAGASCGRGAAGRECVGDRTHAATPQGCGQD